MAHIIYSDTELALIITVMGRVILGVVFVIAGMMHGAAFRPLAATMAARRVPLPFVSLAAGSLFQIIAGAMLACDCWRSIASLGLIVFTAASSVIMLDFWNRVGSERELALGGFISNIALCGGLLIAGFAP